MAASGSNIGKASAIIKSYVRQGMSARKALDEFRGAGFEMRDSYFRKQYASVRNAMARSAEITSLPGHRIPGAEHFQEWRAGKGGKYAYQIPYTSRGIGSGEIVEGEWTIYSDRPRSINWALRQMEAEFDEGNEQSQYGEVLLSATVTGLYKTVPYHDEAL